MIIAAIPEARVRMAFERLMSHSRWPVEYAASVQETVALARKHTSAIIVVQPSVNWIELVAEPAPVLVIASQFDQRLWTSVLDSGAWDLLVEPFETKEVFRILTGAWLYASRLVPITSAPTSHARAVRPHVRWVAHAS